MGWSGLPERIEQKIQPEPMSGCWLWTAGLIGYGYGGIFIEGETRTAHRVIYEMLVGSVPEGLVLDHFVCDLRCCVNPEHVRPVTHHENILRGVGIASRYAGRKACKNGHLLEGSNFYIRKGQRSRVCRTCESTNPAKAAWKQANKKKLVGYSQKWQRKNPEKKKAYAREYQKQNRQEINAWARTWRSKHKERLAAEARERRRRKKFKNAN